MHLLTALLTRDVVELRFANPGCGAHRKQVVAEGIY